MDKSSDVADLVKAARQRVSAGDFGGAATAYREVVRLKPDFAEAHNNLGVVLREQGAAAEAETCYREAVRLKPDFAEAHNNLGVVLRDQDDRAGAAACYREAVRLKPDFAEAHSNLGVALREQGDPTGAEAALTEAIRLRPTFAVAHWNLALALLQKGDYERGWAEYEWRWKPTGVAPRAFAQPRWDGGPLAGRTVLLWADAPADVLAFLRYVARVKQKGGTVLLECAPALHPLLAGVTGIDRVAAPGGEPPAFDVHAPLAALPTLLGVARPDQAPLPPLKVDPAAVERCRTRLGAAAGLKVGISGGDGRRPIPPRDLAAVAVPGAHVYGLGTTATGGTMTDLAPDPTDAAALAAAIRSVDLVIAGEGLAAHLAAALGAPVWVLAATPGDWRWTAGREASDWYPSATVFRRAAGEEWADVLARVTTALAAKVPAAPPAAEPAEPSPEAAALHAATQHFRAGQTAEASRLCRDVLAANPTQPVANYVLGLIALNSGKPQAAVPHFRTAATADSGQHLYPYNLALALLGAGDHAAAEAAMRDAIRLRPASSSSHKALGDLLRKQKKSAEAEAAYREAVRLNPENVEALVRLGNAVYARDQADEAEDLFRKAVALKPTYSNAHYNLGVVLDRRGRKAEAEACYREARRLTSREPQSE